MGVRTWLGVTGWAWLAAIAAAGSSRGQEPASLRQTLLTEAPKRWDEYLEFAQRLQGRASWRYYNLGQGRDYSSGGVVEWKQGKDGSLVVGEGFAPRTRPA